MAVQTMDDILVHVGDCGRFQLLLTPLSMGSVPMAIWSIMTMVFGIVEPDWWCESRDSPDFIPTPFENESIMSQNWMKDHSNGTNTLALQSNLSRSGRDENLTEFEGVGHNGGRLKFQCGGGNESNFKCDRLIFATTENTVVSEFQLVCDLAWVTSLLISVQMAGVLVGSYVSGQMSDLWGRKKAMVFMIITHIAFSLVAGFSTSWEMFAVMRTLIGFSVGGIITIGFAFAIEFVGVRWRAAVGAVPLWGIGVITFSLVVWTLKDWRHIHFATSAFSCAALLAWIFIPESARWLSARGQANEAQHVLHKIARWNGREVPEEELLNKVTVQKEQTVRTKYTLYHLFAGWKMCKISLVVGFMWFMCSLTYYAISFSVQSLSGDFYFNLFLLSLMEVPGTAMVYPAFARFGRQKVLGASFLLVALTSIAVVPVHFFAPTEYVGTVTNGLAMCGRMALNFAWAAQCVYDAELYPTVVRSLGMGYANTMARAGGIIVPYVLVGADSEVYKIYAIAGAAMLLVAICPFLLHETKGRPLVDELHARKTNGRLGPCPSTQSA